MVGILAFIDAEQEVSFNRPFSDMHCWIHTTSSTCLLYSYKVHSSP